MRKNLIQFSKQTAAEGARERKAFKVRFKQDRTSSGFRKIRPKNLLIGIVVAIAVAVAATIFVVETTNSASPREISVSKEFTAKNVGMQMFGYNWNSLKNECAESLGPAGVDWILVDPPSDHIVGTQWWIHYQPTNYDIIGDHGNRSEFKAMVAACKSAGVSVLADVVFNHMAGGSGDSFGGKPYGDNLTFGDLYTSQNFHEGLSANDEHFCDYDISNWDEPWERTNCRFPGLPDLATEQDWVRTKIADYLKDLQSLGVAGFRFDAAKHVDPLDIKAILGKLDKSPFVIQEVPGDSTIGAEYLPTGHIWAWQTATDLQSAFGSADSVEYEMVGMSDNWEAANDPDLSITWVNNHDTERHGESLSFADGDRYFLAQQFLLAQPFGQPMLYSGFRFEDSDESAPQDADGKLFSAICGSDPLQFTCTNRRSDIIGMIAFHKEVAGVAKTGENGANGFYSMQRDGKGFFALNNNDGKANQPKIATGMEPGTYCNLITAGLSATEGGNACSEDPIVIDADGNLVTKIDSLKSVAILAKYKLG